MDVNEAIRTLISIRRFSKEAVPLQDIEKIIEAGTRAPSAANTQPWEFILVLDKTIIFQLAKINHDCALIYIENRKLPMDEQRKRYLISSLKKMSNACAMIVICVNWKRADFMRKDTDLASLNAKLERLSVLGSVFPAMQNMLLQARELNVGCWITMYHLYQEDRFKHVLGIPEYVEPVVMISVGRPKGSFKENKRMNYKELVHLNKW